MEGRGDRQVTYRGGREGHTSFGLVLVHAVPLPIAPFSSNGANVGASTRLYMAVSKPGPCALLQPNMTFVGMKTTYFEAICMLCA